MSDIQEKATQPAEGQITTDKPQVLWDGNTLVVVLPLDKMPRPMARGLLREAEDMACIRYMQIEQAKKKIIQPGSTGIKGKLARVFGR